MAVSILEKPNDEERSALRDWAVEILNEKSPLKFTREQRDELKNEGLMTQRLAELSGGSFGSPFLSPDLTKAAIIKKTSTPLSGRPGEHPLPSEYFLIIYDLHTGRQLSQFEADSGNWSSESSSSKIVWFRDSSKLLICWQDGGRLVAFDVAHGKRLGDRQTFNPNNGRFDIRDVVFSQDGLSAVITDGDGQIDVWQLP